MLKNTWFKIDMPKKCKKCGGLKRTKIDFNIAKEDAFGFFIFSIALAAPVGFLAFLWGLIEDSLPLGSSFLLLAFSAFRNKRIYIYLYILILVPSEFLNFVWFYMNEGAAEEYNFLSPEIAFILAFYSIGFGVYRFFSLFVDYELAVKTKCLSCNKEVALLEFPNRKDA